MNELPSTFYLMTQIFPEVLPMMLNSLYIKQIKTHVKLFNVFLYLFLIAAFIVTYLLSNQVCHMTGKLKTSFLLHSAKVVLH